ncbi:hypothetical protein ACIQWN_38840 [Streptomyces vinaceus]|uniref:hypothetical protein n=1 Tax=Streptomyces vinaceus TaxID=1960 RepID=UPI0038093664
MTFLAMAAVDAGGWHVDRVVLTEDGSCLYMDVGKGDAIWLAVLSPRLTPTHLDLVFCDESYTFDIRVPAGSTEAELTALVAAVG